MLCTQLDVEYYGHVDFTNEPDDAVALWIGGVTAAIEGYAGRPLLRAADRVQLFTALNFHTIRLDGYPVDPAGIVIDDNGTVLASGDDYIIDLETGVIRRVADGVPRAWQYNGKLETISVTYTAGYAEADPTNDIPGDLRQACAVAVGDLFRAGQKWAASRGADSVTIADIGTFSYASRFGAESFTPFATALSPQVMGLLGPYIRYHAGSGGAIA